MITTNSNAYSIDEAKELSMSVLGTQVTARCNFEIDSSDKRIKYKYNVKGKEYICACVTADIDSHNVVHGYTIMLIVNAASYEQIDLSYDELNRYFL